MLDETFAESVVHAPVPLRARLRGTLESLLCSGSRAGCAGDTPATTAWSAHKILGQRLRPFSFWHAANLDFIQSPFIGHPGNLDFAALYLAAKCCQLKYPSVVAAVPAAMRRLNQFIATLRFGKRFAKDPAFTFRQLNNFSLYLADYHTCGPIHAQGEGSRPIKIPWYLYHVALLVKHAGYTKEQAWNAPVAESQWWTTALLAANGAEIDILTPQDRLDLAAAGVAL